MREQEIKDQVRQFYDQVGWQITSDGMYQNARYEDLRPVSQEYVHSCHQRVKRYLKPQGKYLLDAGSGPVQYPDYLTYSQDYSYRVCADISITALQEARLRLKERGLYVDTDVANLPFRPDAFEGIVSLHTFHHLPLAEQKKAYAEITRVLTPGCNAVVVNGWTYSPLMHFFRPLVNLVKKITTRNSNKGEARKKESTKENNIANPTGTFIEKMTPAWLKQTLSNAGMNYEILVWRSVNSSFLRTLVHRPLGGKYFLRLLFWLEERFPHYLGENGQYPLVIIRKGGSL